MTINKRELKKQAIHQAAYIARGQALSRLHDICLKQETIRTTKLEREVERLYDYFRDVAYLINSLQKEIDCD